MRRLVALVAACLLALTGPAGQGAAQGAAQGARAGQSAQTRYAQQAFAATNAQRADAGLRALRSNRCLQTFARKQARAMAQREQMYHQELGPVLTACGLSSVGENVAYGYPSGRAVVNQGWMHSDGHRANILNPGFRLMAIGARQGHDGRWYVAQVFGSK